MFSKTKEPEAIAVPQPAAAKRSTRPNGVPSIISAEVTIRGTLVSGGDVQVDGKIDGDIRAAALVVGEKAVIVGDVYAEDAVIRGRVEGSICARKVQLCATCHVAGNILHESLSVESGAFFEGNCRHSDNPLADAPEAGAMPRQAASAPAHPAEHRKAPPAHAAKAASEDAARPAANFAPLKN